VDQIVKPRNAHEIIIAKLNEYGASYTLHSHELLLSSKDAYERDNFEFDVENGFKTLAFQVGEQLVLAVIHGRDKVDYKKFYAVLEINRKDLKCANAELLLSLGYEPGGISPIPVAENTRVIVDSAILKYERIVCGSGIGATSIEINSRDLLNIVGVITKSFAK
jgi:prolyl-tRNA editing enzyme YbaK/EbsC (Cys-tRNA(Pro) deacylase)